MDNKKKWKYGSYAFLTTIFVLGIFILLTMVISKQNWTIDMTQNKLNSLSKQTTDVLKGLKQDVNVHVFYISGREDTRVNRLLDTYKKCSSHVKLEYIDVLKNPAKIKAYKDIALDANQAPVSVVFESPKRVKVVNYYEMFTTNAQQQQEFIGEQKFTNAVRFVYLDKIPIVYYLQGHKEPSLDAFSMQAEYLRMQNYNVQSLNLITEKKIPDNANMIIDVSPQTQFLPEEITEIKRFIDNGGKGAFFVDVQDKDQQNITSLKDMVKTWGIEIQDSVAVEGSKTGFYQHPTYILPQLQAHQITDPISSAQGLVLAPYSRTLKLSPNNGYSVSSLLKTTANSWGKLKVKNDNFSKEAGDAAGPLDLAAVSSKQIKDKSGKVIGESKVFVAGTSGLINQNVIQQMSGNLDFFLNVFGWMRGTSEEITIRPQQSINTTINMNNVQRVATIILVLLIIPLTILIIGLIIWIRRKNR